MTIFLALYLLPEVQVFNTNTQRTVFVICSLLSIAGLLIFHLKGSIMADMA